MTGDASLPGYSKTCITFDLKFIVEATVVRETFKTTFSLKLYSDVNRGTH